MRVGLFRFGQFTTFYFFSSQISKSYVKRYVMHPFSSTNRRGIFCLISQNLSAILSQICYLYCPSANVLSLPCTLFRGIFQKTYRFPHPKWAQPRSNLYRSWNSVFTLDGCVWECVHVCVFVWAYQHSFLKFCSCCKNDSYSSLF